MKLLFHLILFTCLAASSQILDNRIAVANARASVPASQPVLFTYGNGSSSLLLRARFNQDSIRATWDFSTHLNLIHSSGVRLRVRCQNPQNASQFNIYLNIGGTWYAAPFSPTMNNSWEDLFIPKSDFLPEGAPHSWETCSTVRIAAWKRSPGDVSISLAELEFTRPNIPVALLRSGISVDSSTQESYRHAAMMGKALSNYGLRPAVIEDNDCLSIHLKPYSFVLIPFVQNASPMQLNTIVSLLKQGVKAGVFHELPTMISAQMRLSEAKYIRPSELSMTLGGVISAQGLFPAPLSFKQTANSLLSVPKVSYPMSVAAWWTDAIGKTTTWPAVLRTPFGFWMTQVFHSQDASSAAFLAHLTELYQPGILAAAATSQVQTLLQFYQDKVRDRAQQLRPSQLKALQNLLDTRQWEAAIILSQRFTAQLNQSAATQPSSSLSATECRGVWCQTSSGLPGSNWQDTTELLQRAHINTIFPLVATPFMATYSSLVLPSNPTNRTLESCLSAAHAKHMQVHAWVNCLHVQDAPPAVRQSFQQANRLQMNAEGECTGWLCPSVAANQQLVLSVVRELATRFPLDGICLDCIRFESSQTCTCPSCKTAFEQYASRQITNWPQAILPKAPLHQMWIQFRQKQITDLVLACCITARKARPSIRMSAAVFPELSNARTAVAQNWQAWLQGNGLNTICPMNYHNTTLAFNADVQNQLIQAGGSSRILPAIGVSVHPLTVEQVLEQIQVTRNHHATGFVLFQLTPQSASQILPRLTSP